MSPQTVSQRKTRACDLCRKKKARCDGDEKTRHPCSLCTEEGRSCTYISIVRRRAPTPAYATALEDRLQHMQAVLEKYASKAEIAEALGFSASPDLPSADEGLSVGKPYDPHTTLRMAVDSWFRGSPKAYENSDSESGDGHTNIAICSVGSAPGTRVGGPPFLGTSSGADLVQIAAEWKENYSGLHRPLDRLLRSWDAHEWSVESMRDVQESSLHSFFPPPDLLVTLIEAFYHRVQPFFPIIHRPTFEAQIADRLHYRNEDFARVVLMVCATGSVWVEDPRACHMVEGVSYPGHHYYTAAGGLTAYSVISPTNLFKLQSAVLIAVYNGWFGTFNIARLFVATGLRWAQDAGSHRKSSCPNEHYKRAVWCLFLLDNMMSAMTGVPPGIRVEDIDIALPQAFTEEAETAAAIDLEFFICALRAALLIGPAIQVRSKYPSIAASPIPTASELDGELQGFLASVPECLRWNPNCGSLIQMEQSAKLHFGYSFLVMLMHFPSSLSGTRSPSDSELRELDICVNVARSCTHVLMTLTQHAAYSSPPELSLAFISAVVLLTSLWVNKGKQPLSLVHDLIFEVKHCMRAIRGADKPWRHNAVHRTLTILSDLAGFNDSHSIGLDLTVPQLSTPHIGQTTAATPFHLSSRASASNPPVAYTPQPREVAVTPATPITGTDDHDRPYINSYGHQPSGIIPSHTASTRPIYTTSGVSGVDERNVFTDVFAPAPPYSDSNNPCATSARYPVSRSEPPFVKSVLKGDDVPIDSRGRHNVTELATIAPVSVPLAGVTGSHFDPQSQYAVDPESNRFYLDSRR